MTIIVSERRENSKKYVVRNCEKKSIFQRDFDQKISKNSDFSSLLVQTRKFCRQVAYFYLSNGNHSSNHDELAKFYNSSF